MAAGKPAGPSISNETRPVQSSLNTDVRTLNYSNTIYHNGVTFNFASGVTWGRYISGDPWVLVSGPGITLLSVEPGLKVVSSNVYAVGVTFNINGSQKNRTPFSQGFSFFGATAPGYVKQAFDRRADYNGISGSPFVWQYGANWDSSIGLTYPTGLSYGDSIIASISSFDANTSTNYACVELRYNNRRNISKRYSILTAVNTTPSVDSYRPPYNWPNPKTRPTFTESQYERNINDYLIDPRTNRKCITGLTFAYPVDYNFQYDERYNNAISSYKYILENLLKSSYVFEHPGYHPALNGGQDDVQPPGSTFNYGQALTGYMGEQLQSIWYPFFAGMFIKDIPFYLRQKALRKVVQYGIDLYGYMMSGGVLWEGGAHATNSVLPFIRLAGWVFGSSGITMLNIHNNSRVSDYMRSGVGLGANVQFDRTLYNSNQDYWNKVFSFPEYAQKGLIYNFGATLNGEINKWFNIGNPNVIVPYDRGFTYSLGYPNGFTGPNLNSARRLFTADGWTGAGSYWKYGGITLDTNNPATIVNSVMLGSNLIYSNPIPGKYGKLNLSPVFKPRTPNLMPEVFAPAQYANGDSMTGLIVKIVSGGGSGPTEYRIARIQGLHEDIPAWQPGLTFNISITLDRSFQNGIPDSTSVIDIYPFSQTDNFPLPTFDTYSIAGIPWGLNLTTPFGVTFTTSGNQVISLLVNAKYSNRDYLCATDGNSLRYYSVLKHLGITQDQFIYDYHDKVYFDNDVPRWAIQCKLFGQNGVGSIKPQSFDSLLIANFRGLTQGSYIGSVEVSSGLDLPGFTA